MRIHPHKPPSLPVTQMVHTECWPDLCLSCNIDHAFFHPHTRAPRCVQLLAVFTADGGATVTPPTALPTFFGAGAPFDRPGFFAQPSCARPACNSSVG